MPPFLLGEGNTCILRILHTKRSIISSRNLHQSIHGELRNFDVCIVGAGPCGSVAANLLLQSPENVSIAIVDKKEFKDPKPIDIKYGRVFAISRQSMSLLKAADVWEPIIKERHAHPFYNIITWDSRIKNAFKISGNSKRPLGYITSSMALDCSSLGRLAHAEEHGKRICHVKSSIEKVEFHTNYSTVHMEDGSKIKAQLVVGADGFNSAVRRNAGIGMEVYNYNQKAIICTVLTKKGSSKNKTAWQRFLTTGPIALLPLTSDGYCSVVWTLPSYMADKVASLSLDDLSVMINAAFHNEDIDYKFIVDSIVSGSKIDLKEEAEWGRERFLRFGDKGYSDVNVLCPDVTEVLPGTVKTLELRLALCNSYIGHRVALVGDAAHVVHPMAGLGLNIGLDDVRCLDMELKKSLSSGVDIGNVIYLKDYARERFISSVLKAGAIHLIKVIFDSENSIISSFRSFFISTVDSVPLVKKLIMKYVGSSG